MTTTAQKLVARAEDLPEGSVRRRVLEGARRFKAAWVEFGRLLSEVKREGLWREWGYPSFERYCAKELFVRPATADKLTASYGFLERHEPELARPRAEGKAPPFEVIEVLSRAEASGRRADAPPRREARRGARRPCAAQGGPAPRPRGARPAPRGGVPGRVRGAPFGGPKRRGPRGGDRGAGRPGRVRRAHAPHVVGAARTRAGYLSRAAPRGRGRPFWW
jgi:hypothetical protein